MSIIKNLYKIQIGTLSFLILFAILGSINISAQAYIQTFEIDDYYQITEYTENLDSHHIYQDIEIPLGSDRWTVESLEFNLSNIELEREIFTIEQEGGAYEEIKFGQTAYGIELNITEETILYGVEIFGYEFGDEAKTGTTYSVQIQGFNSGPNEPNGTILAQTDLNMSTIPSWYTQMFTSGVNLTVGRYYLVINATYSSPSDKSKYTWYYNSESTSLLYRAKYEGSWDTEQGKTFTHKLIQKVSRSYNPEEINMTLNIGDTTYFVNNGTIPRTGEVTVSGLELEVLSPSLQIPINTNTSVEVEFDLDYRINLMNQFYAEAQMTVEPQSSIAWIITPSFERTNYNYSIEMNIPTSWSNLEVFRNGFNVSGETELVDQTLLIQNETIFEGSSWSISAQSPNLDLGINVQQETYEPGQILQLSIDPPHQSGNLSLFFVDSDGFEYYYENKTVDSENVFSFEIPTGILAGAHFAVIYWNNQTDAGVLIQDYNIEIPFSLTTTELILIVAGSIAVPLFGVVTVTSVKKNRRKKEAARQKIFNKYQDVLHLNHIIIADKKSGLDIYDESLSGKSMEATLITGFLEAIRSFGIELTNSEKESQTIKLEYQNSKILMSEFKNLRITLVMTDNPSQDFVDSVKNLSEEIEEKFRMQLENFKGNTTAFQNLNFFISKHLNTSLIYPLKLNLSRKTRLTSSQKSVIQKVKGIMKQNNTDYFYVSQLFSEKKGFQTGWGVSILKLIDKGIFFKMK